MTKKVKDEDLKGVAGGGPYPRSVFDTREPQSELPGSKSGSGDGGGVGNTGMDDIGGGGGTQELG